MSKESIESRRAFFKNLGKGLGAAACAAAFMTVTGNVEATYKEPPRSCACGSCGACTNGCTGSCKNGCITGSSDYCRGGSR